MTLVGRERRPIDRRLQPIANTGCLRPMSPCAILLIIAAVFFFLALFPQRPAPGHMPMQWSTLGLLTATLAALAYVLGIHAR